MRRAFALLAGIAALALPPAAANAQDVTVGIIEDDPQHTFVWDTDEIQIDPGQTVRWNFNPTVSPGGPPTAVHDVRIYDGLEFNEAFKLADSGYYIPAAPEFEYFDYTFEDEGQFLYVCSVHPEFMRGVVQVGDPPDPVLNPPALKLNVKPKQKAISFKKRVAFTPTVRNVGKGENVEDAEDVTVCAKFKKKLVKLRGGDCLSIAQLPVATNKKQKFTFKPTKKARNKKVKIKFIATASNAKRVVQTVTLKVRRK
jgi:plastocyanin